MDEVCVWCGEDVGHEPDCPQVAMDAMQQHIEELTEERDSLSSKLERAMRLESGRSGKPTLAAALVTLSVLTSVPRSV